MKKFSCRGFMAGGIVLALNNSVPAQTPPWDSVSDFPVSAEVCEVIHTANAELVILLATGELAVISGRDTPLEGTLVDDAGRVFSVNEQIGAIEFAADADGFRSLWWTSATGRVLEIDSLTFEVSESELFPEDFANVACLVCESQLWDDPRECEDPIVPPVTVRICGNDVVIPMIMSFGGLFAFGFPLRRRRMVTANR